MEEERVQDADGRNNRYFFIFSSLCGDRFEKEESSDVAAVGRKSRDVYKRQGLALLSGIAYLFYDFFLGGLMFSPFLVIYLRIWEKQYIKKQQQEFCAQFKMSLQ